MALENTVHIICPSKLINYWLKMNVRKAKNTYNLILYVFF